jgi:hypothetical protein
MDDKACAQLFALLFMFFYLSIEMFHKPKSEQVKQVISQSGRLLLSNADLEFVK